MPLMGAADDLFQVTMLLDATWVGCQECLPTVIDAVAVRPDAVLVLNRACMLQWTGTVRAPHGTGEGDKAAEQMRRTDPRELRVLTETGSQLWVDRARLFASIGDTATRDLGGRVLERPKTTRPTKR